MQRDRLLFTEALDAAQRVIELTAGRDATDLQRDRTVREAVLWNYTVLGEALSQLSDAAKSSTPTLAWRDAARMRNRIVHGYWSADLDVLLATARDDVPAMVVELHTRLDGYGQKSQ